jgi:hypothetical protein
MMEIEWWVFFAFCGALYVVLGRDQKAMRKRVDETYGDIHEITQWLIEIDPRFDEERRVKDSAIEEIDAGEFTLAGMHHLDLVNEKEERGERTLSDPLRREWRQKQEEGKTE